jgi:hypothetical protein
MPGAVSGRSKKLLYHLIIVFLLWLIPLQIRGFQHFLRLTG